MSGTLNTTLGIDDVNRFGTSYMPDPEKLYGGTGHRLPPPISHRSIDMLNQSRPYANRFSSAVMFRLLGSAAAVSWKSSEWFCR